MVDLADAPVVAILTRAPSASGKSRLFRALGRPADPTLLSALLLDTVEAATVPGTRLVIAVEPPDACSEIRALVPGIEVIAQVPGTLGDRMAGAMRILFSRGARAVALIGSDVPDLPGGALESTFAHLDAAPKTVVIGPARDGGYYLIAATREPPVFDQVEWGSEGVLTQTLELARRAGISVRLLEPASDVDDISTLAASRGPRTAAWWRQYSGLNG